MHAGKVVLVSSSPYTVGCGAAVLQQLVDDKVELFCAVGVDAANWEDALDWLCIGPSGESLHFITTTSHPDESVEEVIAFAESFTCVQTHKVEVIYV
ncbi:hypothetical protein [Rhodoferax saidenbachensis]|uniref:DUF7684 domain-containing protein n=1 Tax=Rhodoferax saidenbachensis TaxID=1484693 RepID=A0ABU1ZQR2_9BURK|nr:hypothetical protein [Rhodoferax saidenbachensis]MDR7307895.1 hypothetical protein [Rhodoferax saidenbachensis]